MKANKNQRREKKMQFVLADLQCAMHVLLFFSSQMSWKNFMETGLLAILSHMVGMHRY